MTENPIPSESSRTADPSEAERHAEEVSRYRKLAETHPEEESHLFALAWALYDSGQREEALESFECLFGKELARRVFTGFAYDELVRIYRDEGNWEKLIPVCERAGAAQPEDVGVLRTLGEAYLAAGRPAEAGRIFEKLTALEPQAPENWCSLGNALLAAGDPGRAEAACTRAAEIDPADAATFFARFADACSRAGFLEQARSAWTRCLVLRPDEPLYLMGLGAGLILEGKVDAAEEAYGQAASLNPAVAGSCWHRLGNLLTREGLHVQATEAFIKAIGAEPKNPRYLLRLAASYAARGLDDPAAEALRKAQTLLDIRPS
jgi:tetratricopeptide (TPR) repeat protein